MATEGTMTSPMDRFYLIGERLGHNRADLEAGRTVKSTLVIRDVDALRELMHIGSHPTSTAAWTNSFRERLGAVKGDEVDALLTRVSAYVFAEGEAPSAQDRDLIKPLFPMRVETESGPLVLAPGQVMQFGSDGGPAQWLNYSTVTMGYGSSMFVRNTALTFSAVTIIKQGATGASPLLATAPWDLGILGLTGARGGTGLKGNTGGNGSKGPDGTCKCSNTEPGNNGGNGSMGYTGVTGGSGQNGNNGVPSLPATINITGGITGANPVFTIGTMSGAGGPGGAGGRGGTGGAGGNGGYGTRCSATCDDGGNGATGGQGGRGGTGGAGGDGVAGQPISVTVPTAFLARIMKAPFSAPGGDGGTGGPGGAGGAGGLKGGSAMYCSDGSDAAAGGGGGEGPRGQSSSVQGIPGTITITGT